MTKMTATIDGEVRMSNGPGPGQRGQFSGFLQRRREQVLRAAQEAERKREVLSGLKPIFEKFGLSRVYVFGSVTREFCRTDSDIDLYVESVDAEKYWELWRELEEYTQERIDLHCQRDDPVFVRKIKERGWLIYELEKVVARKLEPAFALLQEEVSMFLAQLSTLANETE